MFCMNCGQTLPDGAKFCMSCGTPQGAVSPTVSTGSETLNLYGSHTFVPAMCPNCNAHMKVDSSSKIARCDNCGTECLVQDAIKALTVRGNVQVGNATINVNGANTESLLKRAEIMLADGDFQGAMEKCDSVLDSDPTNAQAYIVMLMAILNVRREDDLANCQLPFDHNKFYQKAMQFGDEQTKAKLVRYIEIINGRIEAELVGKLRPLKVNDTFYLGSYRGQKLFWRVLFIQDNKLLVISTNSICNMPYNVKVADVTWEDCTLRKWLNNYFINDSFNNVEKERISPLLLSNGANPKYNTPGGNPTTDKVFLLSFTDIKLYFPKYRQTGSVWWLRSPGFKSHLAGLIDNAGVVNPYGYNVNRSIGVRPAMWLKLD